MEPEKLLPVGEPAPQNQPPSYFHLENKINSIPSVVQPPPVPPPVQLPVQPPGIVRPIKIELPQEKIISQPVLPRPQLIVQSNSVLSGTPSPKQQQWGVVISIVIIVLMVIIGAFYAWGQRIAENQFPAEIIQ